MSNPPVNPQLALLIGAAQYVPSNRAIRARNEFWAQPGVVVPDTEDLASICSLAPNDAVRRAIRKDWNEPGFTDWFLSPEWEIEESQRLIHQSLQRLGEILRDEEEAGTVISAAKEAREIWSKLRATKTEKFADAAISEMSQDELREFIKRNSSVVGLVSK